ncbi:hypothetical protein tb265_09180 [Gemmatimonadetes bacterium T265]|nr:hypothetical protein tb265_09180 [Gemmatimonadetes bacterium T265]
MSTLRNIAAHLWHGSIVRKANVVLGITGAALSAACAAENAVAPVAPSSQRAHADLSTQDSAFDVNGDGRLSPAEQAAKKAARDSIKQYNKAQMDSLKADWQAYKRAVQSGLIEAAFLRCEPKPEVSVTRVIGPKGGTFNIGPHKFEVPAGALDTNVTISATAPTNSRDELRFEPHGLQFNKPVQMTISYKGCVVPDSVVLGVSYVSHPEQSAAALTARTDQRMPTHDDKGTSAVTALTDHFSGYMVTWTRTGATN